jgi:hypothetical protein
MGTRTVLKRIMRKRRTGILHCYAKRRRKVFAL